VNIRISKNKKTSFKQKKLGHVAPSLSLSAGPPCFTAGWRRVIELNLYPDSW